MIKELVLPFMTCSILEAQAHKQRIEVAETSISKKWKMSRHLPTRNKNGSKFYKSPEDITVTSQIGFNWRNKGKPLLFVLCRFLVYFYFRWFLGWRCLQIFQITDINCRYSRVRLLYSSYNNSYTITKCRNSPVMEKKLKFYVWPIRQ